MGAVDYLIIYEYLISKWNNKSIRKRLKIYMSTAQRGLATKKVNSHIPTRDSESESYHTSTRCIFSNYYTANMLTSRIALHSG